MGLVSLVGSPEGVVFVVAQQLVIWVIHCGSSERWGSCESDEGDYGCSEQITTDSGVWLLVVNFWGHVGVGSQNGFGLTVQDLGESEVGDFEVVLVVIKDVFGFHVSVGDVFLVHVV